MKIFKLALAGLMLAAAISPASEAPTPEHVKWMKDLGAQMGAIRKGADVQKNAQDMQATLKLVGAFWKARNSEVAMKSCGDSFKGAKAVAEAGDNKEAVMAGMKMIGAGCKGCHDAHREKISDTENRIK